MAVRLIYETHSTTLDNENRIATGWLPGKLSHTGREQAAELGARRRGSVHVVYTSDLARAVETAGIAFAGTSTPVIQDWRLRECNYGEWNGMPITRLDGERINRVDTPFPGGESYRDVVERTRDFLTDLVCRHDGQTVLVISHSANRWAIEHILCGTPLKGLVGAPFDWRPGWEFVLNQ